MDALGQFDWTLYWFMFPVAIFVATAAMLSGIGGAALFAPIFLIVFPLLGPDYPFHSVAAAIGAAMFTGSFGFLSGLAGYARRRLIDIRAALPFIAVGLPAAIAGALVLDLVRAHEDALRLAYGILMLTLSAVLLRRPALAPAHAPERGEVRSLTDSAGRVYRYPLPRQGRAAPVTALGGFLTGLLGVGIGETVVPQLVRRHRVPVPVAAATSVFAAFIVLASASFAQISALIAGGGPAAVPWHVLVYTVPGVLIGGQIGPWLQGRIPGRAMERSIAALFIVIGAAMAGVALRRML